MDPIPAEIAENVRRELGAEKILWAASPDRWGYSRRYWTNALMGIPFTAFAFFWTYQAAHIPSKAGAVAGFFPLWGLMFVGIGLFMLLSPFFAAWRANNVYYVVTDRRAVIFEKLLKLNVRSFNASALTTFERVSSGGTSGNIFFQRVADTGFRSGRTREIGFIGLRDFTGAEQALRQLISANGKA
jgi:hypothetical protein